MSMIQHNQCPRCGDETGEFDGSMIDIEGGDVCDACENTDDGLALLRAVNVIARTVANAIVKAQSRERLRRSWADAYADADADAPVSDEDSQ